MMKSRKKEFKRKYFGSLTHQLILISICLVTGTLLLCWFINTVFLEPYYVINKQNSVALQLCQDFIDVYEEQEPEFEIESKEDLLMAKIQWERYQVQCAYFSNLLVNMGNKIYLGNKVDKRGRLYSSGYHISPQGNSYRKAVVEFYEEVIVECPPEYKY